MNKQQALAMLRRMREALESATNRAIISNIIRELENDEATIALAIHEARVELQGSDADRDDAGIEEALNILREAVAESDGGNNRSIGKKERDFIIDSKSINNEINKLEISKETMKQLALSHRSKLVGEDLKTYDQELKKQLDEIDSEIRSKTNELNILVELNKLKGETRKMNLATETKLTKEERAYAAGIAFAKIEIAKRTKGATKYKLTESESTEILRYNTPEAIAKYSGNTVDLRAAAKYPFETMGTTSEEFIPATTSILGQNNLGIFIPTTVLYDLLQIRSREGAFFSAVRKLSVAEKIDLPYLEGSSGAEWVDELDCTPDQAKQFKKLELGFCNLAKYVKITWSVARMTPENLLRFVLTEIRNSMDRALNIAVLYGRGKNATVTEQGGTVTRNTPQPYGVTYQTTNPDQVGVSAKKMLLDPSLTEMQVNNGEGFRNVLEAMERLPLALKELNPEALDGARYYISFAAYHALFSAKDSNGDRIFGITERIEAFHLFGVTMDWDLQGMDIIFGNPQNYILNEIEPIRIYNDSNIKCRYDEYAAFGMYDGKGIPNSFIYVSDSTEPRSSVPPANLAFRKKHNYRGQNPLA